VILHELSFAKIIIIRNNLAEVLVNEGVEINMDMVEEYHNFLCSNLMAPFYLLINKINTYSYDFEAQKCIATLPEIEAMAVVSYNRVTSITTESLSSFPRGTEWNIKIFEDRNEAIEWLTDIQNNR